MVALRGVEGPGRSSAVQVEGPFLTGPRGPRWRRSLAPARRVGRRAGRRRPRVRGRGSALSTAPARSASAPSGVWRLRSTWRQRATLRVGRSRVSAKAWPPVPSATKNRSLVRDGLATASSAARPGLAIGTRRQALDRRRCCRASPARSRCAGCRDRGCRLPPTSPYTMVGSDCSFMRLLRRLTKTPATRGALVGPAGLLLDDGGEDHHLLAGVFTGTSAVRRGQIWLSTSRCLARIRLTICCRVVPRSNL